MAAYSAPRIQLTGISINQAEVTPPPAASVWNTMTGWRSIRLPQLPPAGPGNVFQYQLEGVDSGWRPPPATGTWPTLPAAGARMTFRLQAINARGVVSTGHPPGHRGRPPLHGHRLVLPAGPARRVHDHRHPSPRTRSTGPDRARQAAADQVGPNRRTGRIRGEIPPSRGRLADGHLHPAGLADRVHQSDDHRAADIRRTTSSAARKSPGSCCR